MPTTLVSDGKLIEIVQNYMKIKLLLILEWKEIIRKFKKLPSKHIQQLKYIALVILSDNSNI